MLCTLLIVHNIAGPALFRLHQGWFKIMEVDRREKSVEQSTNAISNPSARSENTFFVNCPVAHKKGITVVVRFLYLEIS